jgi:hypothetical protein
MLSFTEACEALGTDKRGGIPAPFSAIPLACCQEAGIMEWHSTGEESLPELEGASS